MLKNLLVKEELINLWCLCSPSLVVEGYEAGFLARGHLYRNRRGSWILAGLLGFCYLFVTSCTAPFLLTWQFQGHFVQSSGSPNISSVPPGNVPLGLMGAQAVLLHPCMGLPHPVPTGFGNHTNKIIPPHHQKKKKIPQWFPSPRACGENKQ